MKHQWLDSELDEFWRLTGSEEQFIYERSHDNRLVYRILASALLLSAMCR